MAQNADFGPNKNSKILTCFGGNVKPNIEIMVQRKFEI